MATKPKQAWEDDSGDIAQRVLDDLLLLCLIKFPPNEAADHFDLVVKQINVEMSTAVGWKPWVRRFAITEITFVDYPCDPTKYEIKVHFPNDRHVYLLPSPARLAEWEAQGRPTRVSLDFLNEPAAKRS